MGKLTKRDDAGESNNEETANFNARLNWNFSTLCLRFTKPRLRNGAFELLVITQAQIEILHASLISPLIGCTNHLLNLLVNAMVNSHCDLEDTIETVHNTVKEAKQFQNAALLRNLTDYRPVMFNQTP